MTHVLAITFDGILQPLGYSQVVRVAIGLSRAGFRYSLLSLERDSDLAQQTGVIRLQNQLAAEGIDWHYAPYASGGGGRAVVANVRTMVTRAHALTRRSPLSLIHARALHAGLVARAVHASVGVPYLFDARSYWVDEQVEEGRRFTSPLGYRLAKRVERALFERAAAVVTLTDLQASDVREGRLGAWEQRPLACIPTCADFGEFRVRTHELPRPPELAGLPPDARIFGIVGALNRSYCVEETIALSKLVLERDPRFHALVLTSQEDEYRRALGEGGVPAARAHVMRVSHAAMPKVLPFVEWGALLLRTNFAKRASVPTKLAEFFAAGVRPVQHGCNDEVSGWVDRVGTGIVLADLGRAALERAADHIVASPVDRERIDRGRAIAHPHFSLEAGITRYRDLLRQIR